MRTTRNLCLALCTAALLAGGTTASAVQERGQDQRQARGTHDAKKLGPAEARRAAEAAKKKSPAEARRATAQKAKKHAPPARHPAAQQHRSMAAEIAAAETLQRGRMAKLKRLRVLAEQAHQADRVKEIDALQQKAIRHHEEMLRKLSAKVGRNGQAAVERATKHGREATAKTPAERRKALEGWKRENPGRSHGVDARPHSARGASKQKARPHTEQKRTRDNSKSGDKEHRNGRDG